MSKIAIVLVLPIEYNTSSMLRCKTIIAALANLGHKIKCYCPNPDVNSRYYSAEKINIPNMDVYRFGRKPWNGNAVVGQCKKSTKKRVMSTIKRLALALFHKVDVFGSTLLYLPNRKEISKDIAKGDFDILLSFSDPMPAHMIAKYCKQKNRKIRYIQQWGDPLASDTISKTAQPVWIRKLIECSLIKPADKVCYVSPFTTEEQKRLFPKQAKKMIFLPTPSLTYKEDCVKGEMLTIGYFGSYNSVARNIIPFYEAAKKCKDAFFYIIGDSDVRLESTQNVKILNRVTPDELNAYMQKIDVIVCLMNLKGNQIPGKVYHDASSTKDILFIKDGEYGDDIQKFFEKYNHYTFVDNDVKSISSAMSNYVTNGVPIRKPVKEFDASNVARKLIEA